MSRTKWGTAKKTTPEKQKPRLPDGLTCECGTHEKYTAYVFAHWREPLTFTCPTCGRKYQILCGGATLIHVPMTIPGGKTKL